jgi:hypothetical protein
MDCAAIGNLLSIGLLLYHNLGLGSVPNSRWQYRSTTTKGDTQC